MTIRYKVIKRESRCSSNSIGKYRLYYEKNTIVDCVPGTLGIFCFKEYEHALKFIGGQNNVNGFYSIIRVKPIGRRVIIKGKYKFLPFPISESMTDDFYKKSEKDRINMDSGIYVSDWVYVYRSVLVID